MNSSNLGVVGFELHGELEREKQEITGLLPLLSADLLLTLE